MIGLEHPERGGGEEVGQIHQFQPETHIGFVGAEPGHRLRIGDARDLADVVADGPRPQRLDDGLAHDHDVTLVDEGHLDVELRELRLPVRAEVLVAVTARDLVVALHPGHHEQLFEQLRRLRQGIPVSWGQPRGDQEVARPFGRGSGQGRSLDLDESAVMQHVTCQAVDLAAHAQGRSRPRAAQVQVAPAQPRLLAHVHVLVDRERQGVGLTQHAHGVGDDLDLPRRQSRILVALGATLHPADDAQAELVAQWVGDLGFADNDLNHPGRVTQVQERDPAVVAAMRDPPCDCHLVPDVGFGQGARLVRAQHQLPPSWCVASCWILTIAARSSIGTLACVPVCRSFT